MKIVITGFMASGKTRVARELARRLDLEMIDLDEFIKVREGRSAGQLIREEGEQAFRQLESAALRELLETHNTGVIALGGGAWIQDANRALIQQYRCLSVWLDVDFEICWGRIELSAEDRPLGKMRERAKKLYKRRKPIYELAKLHIPVYVDDSLDDVLVRITKKIQRLPSQDFRI